MLQQQSTGFTKRNHKGHGALIQSPGQRPARKHDKTFRILQAIPDWKAGFAPFAPRSAAVVIRLGPWIISPRQECPHDFNADRTVVTG